MAESGCEWESVRQQATQVGFERAVGIAMSRATSSNAAVRTTAADGGSWDTRAMAAPRSQRHAFLSYMHENTREVDELQEALEAAGIRVWRDTQDLWPGEDWQAKIRSAIKSDSLAFIACFSSAAGEREKSYQYEELTVAVEEFRLRRPDASWLFTVRFDECEIPDFDLGAGRRLNTSIQRVDLFGEGKTSRTVRLITAVDRIINPPGHESVATGAARAARQASGDDRDRSDVMKALLRNPSADIDLEDLMLAVGKSARDTINDEALFPRSVDDLSWTAFAPVWIDQVRQYEHAMQPALELGRLAGMYGLAQHNRAWQRFMSLFTAGIRSDSGIPALSNLRGYPCLIMLYVVALGSISRKNYSPMLGFAVEPTVRDRYQPKQRLPVVAEVDVWAVTNGADFLPSALALKDDGREIDEALMDGLRTHSIGGRHTPMSDHLHTLLRDLFSDDFADPEDYADAFDQAEILLNALAYDTEVQTRGRARAGYGRYSWRYKHDENPIEQKVLDQVRREKGLWRPLLDGLFEGSEQRAVAALEAVAQSVQLARNQQWP